MKKAVITTGSKQYLVTEGDVFDVELLDTKSKTVDFIPLLIIDGENTLVGKPEITDSKVTAQIEVADQQTDKVTSIRYKAKKRVHTVRGHRQRQTTIKIKSIT